MIPEGFASLEGRSPTIDLIGPVYAKGKGLGLVLGPGWGTLFFGAAFGLVALVRWQRGGGIGWQAWYGAILALIGGSQVAEPSIASVAFPLLIVAVGLALLLRGR